LSLIEIIFLAAALGIDCLVVSFSQGLIFNSNRLKNSIALALTMGLFQGLMPCFGYVGAGSISSFVEPYSKWIVCIIFLALGAKFIYEAFREEKETICCIGLKCLIGMGIATSIDALAAGVSIKFSGTNIVLSALLIGFMSFIMSLAGFWSGNCFKKFPSKALEVTGGMILIFLGIKACL